MFRRETEAAAARLFRPTLGAACPSERGPANEVRSLFADLFAALGIEPNRAFRLTGRLRCSSGEGRDSGKVCRRCIPLPASDVFSRLRVQFEINRLAPRRLSRAISGAQTARLHYFPSTLLSEAGACARF